MPARRKRRRKIKTEKRINYIVIISFLIVLFLLLGVVMVIKKEKEKSIYQGNKFSLVSGNKDEIAVDVFDTNQKKIYSVAIKADTQVEASYNLGVWKLGSLWELGSRENMGGDLIAKTVAYNFLFPVEGWMETDSNYKTGFKNKVRFIFEKNTNMTLVDKLFLFWFLIEIHDRDIERIDLIQSGWLEATVLVDGGYGYILSEDSVVSINALFNDEKFAREAENLIIAKAEGARYKKIVSILEVMGVKPVILDLHQDIDDNCLVSGQSSYVINKMVNVFSCQVDKKEGGVQLQLGSKMNNLF